jgi:hypothetical protein
MKLIYVFTVILFLSMTGASIASIPESTGHLYFEMKKDVNGGQLYGLPVLEWSLTQQPLLIDLEFRNNFTTPRGKMYSFPNHLSSQLEVHFGVTNKAKTTWGTVSLGIKHNYAGNDYKIPEGWEFFNTARFGYSW